LPAAPLTIDALVRAHGDFVWRSVRRLGVAPGSVDDVTQQVFLRAREKLPAMAAGGERGFLYRLALGLASNERRAERRRREDGGFDGEREEAREQSSDRKLEQRQLLDLLLEPLDLDLRAVLVLTEAEELSATEIGELLALPVGTVASRLRRAREEVRASLVRYRARERAQLETPRAPR
jgi:RNA polymerase sigma-70 factor (ECF subfamily)